MFTLDLKHLDSSHILYEKVRSLGVPTRKTEQYKKFPIKSLLEREYIFKEAKEVLAKEGKSLVIKDGIVHEFPKGVKVTYSDSFVADMEHFDALYFMSHILVSKVIYVEVLEDLEFQIHHYFRDEETLCRYRIVVKTKKNTKLSVYENFHLEHSKNSLLLYGLDVEVARDSTLTWIRDENRGDDETSIVATHRFSLDKNATLNLKTFDFDSANSLHLYKIDLEEYATIDASHLLLASKNARRGNVIQINHNKEYGKSVQEARSILKDKSVGIFDAKICVSADAKYADAAQNSKAILLDTGAHMYAKPQLEIYTDELVASHGSSIGALEEEALFYLCSRGIRLDDARKILVLAFAKTLIDTLDNEDYAQKIREAFEKII